jgi:two-component system response regulator PilR (NtrC family)
VVVDADLRKPTQPAYFGLGPHAGLAEVLMGQVPLEHDLDEVERQAILKALEETKWNRTAAARSLGMTLRALCYRLAKLGLD